MRLSIKQGIGLALILLLLFVVVLFIRDSNQQIYSAEAKIHSPAIKPMSMKFNRFAIDTDGQAFATQGHSLYKLDPIGRDHAKLYTFKHYIVGFHITRQNHFIISTDNNIKSPKAPCYIFESINSGYHFEKIKTIDFGCAIFWSISSDIDGNLYIGEYGPKDKGMSKTVWKRQAKTKKWQPIFKANNIEGIHIHLVAVDPYTNDLWVSIGDGKRNRGVFRSTDSGGSFKKLRDFQSTTAVFYQDKIYWGEDKPKYGLVSLRFKHKKKDKVVLNVSKHGNFAGSVYDMVGLDNGNLIVPFMKYAEHNAMASLWYGNELNWQLLMVYPSEPDQAVDNSGISNPDKHGYVYLTGYKIDTSML